MDPTEDITTLLKRSNEGDAQARADVLERIYGELRRIANRHAWKVGETLRPTALINEAYLKLFKTDTQFQNRENLFAYAALAMRQVILNNAEKARAQKRGGDRTVFSLEDADGAAPFKTDVVVLNEILENLEQVHPRHARMLGLCYFAGFKTKEIARILEVSESTVTKDLRFAKAWVRKKLSAASRADDGASPP